MKHLFAFGITGAVIIACGTTTQMTDAGADAAADATAPQHTTTHDCSPKCGGSAYCALPQAPGFCQKGTEGGTCTAGCPGCPALPPPSCSALPAACGGTPTCDCLLTACPGGCGSTKGTCSINADGDWVIGCLSC